MDKINLAPYKTIVSIMISASLLIDIYLQQGTYDAKIKYFVHRIVSLRPA